jgi:N-acetylmuramic acid 6-phosphate etherase
VLDASEIPPTSEFLTIWFRELWRAVTTRFTKRAKRAKDTGKPEKLDLQNRGVTEKRRGCRYRGFGQNPPYTIGAVELRELGCFTACVACVQILQITKAAEVAIVPVVGAEAITGSSRMKAGTAQKMVLNMIRPPR